MVETKAAIEEVRGNIEDWIVEPYSEGLGDLSTQDFTNSNMDHITIVVVQGNHLQH